MGKTRTGKALSKIAYVVVPILAFITIVFIYGIYRDTWINLLNMDSRYLGYIFLGIALFNIGAWFFVGSGNWKHFLYIFAIVLLIYAFPLLLPEWFGLTWF